MQCEGWIRPSLLSPVRSWFRAPQLKETLVFPLLHPDAVYEISEHVGAAFPECFHGCDGGYVTAHRRAAPSPPTAVLTALPRPGRSFQPGLCGLRGCLQNPEDPFVCHDRGGVLPWSEAGLCGHLPTQPRSAPTTACVQSRDHHSVHTKIRTHSCSENSPVPNICSSKER